MKKQYTVGIIEDEVIERQALRLILSQNRPVLQVVFEAEDGNSALELVRRHNPDIRNGPAWSCAGSSGWKNMLG